MTNEERTPFESRLSDGRGKFLAHVIEHGFELELRKADDFIRHFSPAAIMSALAGEAELRANILELTVGIRRRIALKKDPKSSGIDLQIALDEDETDAETVVELFKPDDRVRFLDAPALWRYVTESKFWETDASAPEYARVRQHVVFILERALQDALLTPQDVVEGISVAKLVEHLPKGELVKILDAALGKGRAGKPFADTDLLETTACATLAQHVPLPLIWTGVVAKMADAQKLSSSEVSSQPRLEVVAEDALFDESEAHPDADEDAEVESVISALEPMESGAIALTDGAVDSGKEEAGSAGSRKNAGRTLDRPPPVRFQAKGRA